MTQRLGYPHRTFKTEVLSCDHCITFPIASSDKEPLQTAIPHFTSRSTQSHIQQAAQHLRDDQLVAFPTETVYGLGASALSSSASLKIYAAKKRPADNPLIVHVSDLDMLSTLLPEGYTLPPVYQSLINRFWPGAMTLLFPGEEKVPSVVTCGQKTVAVRMPSHPIARALIALAATPIAAPSANASGRPSPTTAAHVMKDLGGELDAGNPQGRLKYILDGGPSLLGLESTVLDGVSVPGELRILRPGGITVEQTSQVIKEENLNVRLRVYGKDLARSIQQESNPTTPGMKYRHYSPTARVVMLLPSRLFAQACESDKNKRVVHSLSDGEKKGKSFAQIVQSQLAWLEKEGGGDVGIMMSNDGDLARWVTSSLPVVSSGKGTHPFLLPPITLQDLPSVKIHRFDLGPTAEADIYAQRMFDGLRTLDEGPLQGAEKCKLIFVEALDDDGVGLAVMNRLKKAASEVVVVDC